jgi:amidophosphoribosyltransferase
MCCLKDIPVTYQPEEEPSDTMMPNPYPTEAENLTKPDKPEEACGVFGIYAPGEDVAKMTYFGLYALQHRGQESAGIATFDGEKFHLHKEMGLVSQVFNESSLDHLPGYIGVGHTRYSTTGSSRVVNAQPVVVESRLGTLALAHNGNLVNTTELRETLVKRNCNFISTTDSETIGIALLSSSFIFFHRGKKNHSPYLLRRNQTKIITLSPFNVHRC